MKRKPSLKEWVDQANAMAPPPKPRGHVGGPEILIVRDGKYGDFNTPSGHMGAQDLEAGTVMAYPAWYGDSLVESGFAMNLEDAIIEAVEGASDVNATGAAAKLAAEHKIDLAGVEGSGKDGRIIMSDIKKLIQE